MIIELLLIALSQKKAQNMPEIEHEIMCQYLWKNDKQECPN